MCISWDSPLRSDAFLLLGKETLCGSAVFVVLIGVKSLVYVGFFFTFKTVWKIIFIYYFHEHYFESLVNKVLSYSYVLKYSKYCFYKQNIAIHLRYFWGSKKK